MPTKPTWKHSILLLALAAFVTGCSGGGDGGDQAIGADTSVALTDATVSYNAQPRANEELTLSIEQHTGAAQSYTWSVVSQPTGANLVLTPVPAVNGVKFTATVAGDYRVRASSDTESSSFYFYINPNFPFSRDKVNLAEGAFADATHVGLVTNQVWLYSQTLDRPMLEQLAARYPTFQVLGFDSVNGLLLQFDETNPTNSVALRNMRLASGVVSVVYRVVTGDAVTHETDVTPDDGSRFDDGGDNWHLERIGAQQAWDITTGSSNILIGISEPFEGVFNNHEDLIGRFGLIIAQASSGDNPHASSVAGTIGAISDNGIGMSGINWVSKMSTADSGQDELRRLAASGSTKVINASWALVGSAPPEGTDMADALVASAREQLAFDLTRDYRTLMGEYSNHLFVNSAGNGVKGPDGTAIDGRYHSPALHYYPEVGKLRLLPNVLFVAAMLEDGKLRESSNYGESVEIAAPSGFKSIDEGNGYRTFGGSSSAASVVSGVASLIYSVNPNFSASTVKKILIETATEFVTERHTESGNDGATEALANPIPVVNAAAAVRMAADLAAGLKAEVIQSFDNPFVNVTNVQVLSATREFDTAVFTYTLNDATGVSSGPEARITLHDSTVPLTLRSTEVKFRDAQLSTTITGEFEQVLENPNIALNLYNSTSTLPVANAQITIEPINLPNTRFNSVTNGAGANGQTNVFLMSGVYRVIVKAVGYEELSTLINIVNQGQRIVVNLPLTLSTDPGDPVGTDRDACLIGKWSIDLDHLQAQLDSNTVVFGEVTTTLPPDGIGTTDLQVTYVTAVDPTGRIVSTVTQSSSFKFEWSTRDNNFNVVSRGSTINQTSTVTVDGVTTPGSDEAPVVVNGPGDSSSPYQCQGDVWTVEASGQNTVASRFNRL